MEGHNELAQTMRFDRERGAEFAKLCIRNVTTFSGDSLSMAEEVLLSGDKDTALFQLDREVHRYGSSEEVWQMQKSILHFAVLLNDIQLIKDLLTKGATALINQPDYITQFTPLHFALFVENPDMMELLLSNGAVIGKTDGFFGTVPDYARMLGILDPPKCAVSQIQVWNYEEQKVENWAIERFEEEFSIHFTPYIRCGNKYIEELLFSGLQLSPDLAFRAKYSALIEKSSGDENVILAKISDEVGYGVFAGKDFQQGDYIIRYGGMIVGEEEITDWSYAMSTGVEGVVLDAKKYRNLAGMINHSDKPNAEASGLFDKGANQTLIIATEFIPRGTQILFNYSFASNYWDGKNRTPLELNTFKIF